MITSDQVINFIVFLSVLIIFQLTKSFFPKYFEAKGTNQATKEDIGEITEIIENIKSDLIQQNELLKAQLSFKNQHKLNLKTAEREAIFDFNKKNSAWLYSLLRFRFKGYDLENYKELKSIHLEFSKRQYESDLAEAHLTLFMHDKNFKEIKRDFIISIIELENIVTKSIHDVYYRFTKYEIELELEENIINQSKIKTEFYKEDIEFNDNFRKDILAKYREIHKLRTTMIHNLFMRLEQLEQESIN